MVGMAYDADRPVPDGRPRISIAGKQPLAGRLALGDPKPPPDTQPTQIIRMT
jgi:hypothetical protein